MAMLEDYLDDHPRVTAPRSTPFDERDVVLITYGDQITEPGRAPLATLADFLSQHVLGAINGVHILPFYPSSSDDGFAVVDYDRVDPALGDWEDIERIADRFRLMVDAVFNHTSASSRWFEAYLKGDPRFANFFIAPRAQLDLSRVVRPRSTPLLTSVDDQDGQRLVWTTFSPDQVDLNYSNPDVLLAVTRSLLGYLAHGVDILRLDAVAFLWKEPGTSCVHLEETHEIIRLWRTIVDLCSPGTLVITETNVPHSENISYFGDGNNEAHLVYQFPLAPLVLSTFHLADARTLQEWAATLSAPSDRTAFFNFLSSHDGIGLRPAEGLLTRSEIAQLGELSRAHGGGVSYRADSDGRLSPYELNSVLFDALTPADSTEPLRTQVDRFIAAHSLLLSLTGVPAIYIQSLLGSRNWHDGVEQTGRLRSINRQKFDRRQLERELSDVGSRRHQVFTRLTQRIRTRIAEPAFHPNGPQRLVESVPALFAFERTAVDGKSTVLCIHNVSGRPQRFQASDLSVRGSLTDLVTGHPQNAGPHGELDMMLPPYGVAWLRGQTY